MRIYGSMVESKRIGSELGNLAVYRGAEANDRGYSTLEINRVFTTRPVCSRLAQSCNSGAAVPERGEPEESAVGRAGCFST